MLKKFLEETITLVAGKQVEGLIDLLEKEKYVNEFIIAKKLNLTINQTRNILYKISDRGLISYIRKKDKKKGWYTYFWKIEIFRVLEFLRENISNIIEQLNNQIKSRETKQFYFCKRCNLEYNEENALIRNFVCDECGDVFELRDNTRILKEFNKSLDKSKKELELVDREIEKEKEKIEKKKIREIKKAEKEKKGKRIKKTKKKVTKKIKPFKKVRSKKIKKPSKKKSIKKGIKKKYAEKKRITKKASKKKTKSKGKKKKLKKTFNKKTSSKRKR